MGDIETLKTVYPDMWWVFHYKIDIALAEAATLGCSVSFISGIMLGSYRLGFLTPPFFISSGVFAIGAKFLQRARERVSNL